MKDGIELSNGGECGDARTLGTLARLVEAVIAMSTERIRLGTMVTPLTRRRPWKVARETVTLDRLSRGRLILGVGLGDAVHDPGIAAVGGEIGGKRRVALLDEALEVLTGL